MLENIALKAYNISRMHVCLCAQNIIVRSLSICVHNPCQQVNHGSFQPRGSVTKLFSYKDRFRFGYSQ